MPVTTYEKKTLICAASQTACLINTKVNQIKIIVLMTEWEYFNERLWIPQATHRLTVRLKKLVT